jgi:hypothetical protein
MVVAIVLSRDRTALRPALWDGFDRGSWVAPQLGVVLRMGDPPFVANARQRILAGCPVNPPVLRSALG